MLAGGTTLLAIAMTGIVVLVALAYFRSTSDDPGLTTEIALVTTLALGGLAVSAPPLAAGLGVAVAVLLAARLPLHRFVNQVLTESEIKSALVLSASTFIV